MISTILDIFEMACSSPNVDFMWKFDSDSYDVILSLYFIEDLGIRARL